METKKAVIPVKGMTCVNCAAAIQKDISKLAGVKNANVNYANEKAVVEFDPAVPLVWTSSSPASRSSGYQAVTETVDDPDHRPRCVACTGAGTHRIAAIDGVLKAVVNAGAETVEVEYVPGQIGLRDIRRAIEKSGFRAARSRPKADQRSTSRKKRARRSSRSFGPSSS